MSLIVSDRATPKQIELLKKLEYVGNWNLSVTEAAEIIDRLFEEQNDEDGETYGDMYNGSYNF